ncbi:hypothetical protein ACFX15_007666 [Malus domestica]
MSPRKKAEESKNLAISMATKAASFARELKSIRSDLCFMQEQPEEDDLVRLQLEALLAHLPQDLSASFEKFVQGLCLDFSSPPQPTADETNGEDGDGDAAAENKVSQTLRSDLFGFSVLLDDGDH